MSIETIIEKSLKKSDKRAYLQISLIFGLVFAILNGGTIVTIAKYRERTNLLGIAGAIVAIYFVVQAVSLGLGVSYTNNEADLQASIERIESHKNTLAGIENTLSSLNENDPCYSVTDNFPVDQSSTFNTPQELDNSNANCSSGATIEISEQACGNMTGCDLNNCTAGRCTMTIDALEIPEDECELPLCDPSTCDVATGICSVPWGQSCENICDPNRYPKIEAKRDEMIAKIKAEQNKKSQKEGLLKWFPPIAKAANFMTPILMVGLLVAFFIIANRVTPQNVPQYWEAGWISVLVLWGFIASSISIYVIVTEL